MKKFFKSLPVIVIALVALSGLAIAGLLSYYGKFTGTAAVEQSVKVSLDKSTWYSCTSNNGALQCDLSFDVSGVAGDSITKDVYLKNDATANAVVKLDTTCPTDFPTKEETTSGEVKCYADEAKQKLGVTITYKLEDKDNNTVDSTNGKYTLENGKSPYKLTISYTFVINAEPKDYEIITQVTPA